ncbi:MAG TPA: lysine--tRNA ligase [Kofleriaceae bacterium]|jgi:lysyl-tRNA synthetase class 2|nr:lysine--tRNA ligase [Kofleriaceae bacterium]
MSSRPTEQPENTLDRIMEERRAKAKALRDAGSDPYRNDIGPATSLAEVRARYQAIKPPSTEPSAPGRKGPKAEKGEKGDGEGITPIDGEIHRVAGRAIGKRGFGKTVFVPLRDATGDLQLYLNVEYLAADDFANVVPQLDAGDIVVAEGPAFWTKRGELSILARRLWIATKSLRPLPDKWHGMTDVELRYRQRYVDLAISPEVREVFRKRSRIVSGIRRFLDARKFLEVETPMMHSIIGGAAARPFTTHHNALDLDLYLRIAPELYLKRLVVGGFERVYEINRNFRNEGLSRKHNPEFTMLEFYQAYATYTDLMDLTEAMFVELAQDVAGGTRVAWDGVEIELAAPWRRLTIRDAVRELGGVAEASRVFEDPVFAAEAAIATGVPAVDVLRVLLEPLSGAGQDGLDDEARARFKDPAQRPGLARGLIERYPNQEAGRITAGHLGFLVFEATAEAKLVQPTFLTEYPVAVSPLSRKNDKDGAFCDRFELFIHGREIANGFSELNDPDDQRARFLAQVRAKSAGAAETMDFDEDYCRALEVGLPPTAGEGVGIDRVAMLLTGQSSIRDVILFPLMRPE